MSLTFEQLVSGIQGVDDHAREAAAARLQQITSVRAWWIGSWIVAFEQQGSDRAAYGERVMERLAERLSAGGRAGSSVRNLLALPSEGTFREWLRKPRSKAELAVHTEREEP